MRRFTGKARKKREKERNRHCGNGGREDRWVAKDGKAKANNREREIKSKNKISKTLSTVLTGLVY